MVFRNLCALILICAYLAGCTKQPPKSPVNLDGKDRDKINQEVVTNKDDVIKENPSAQSQSGLETTIDNQSQVTTSPDNNISQTHKQTSVMN